MNFKHFRVSYLLSGIALLGILCVMGCATKPQDDELNKLEDSRKAAEAAEAELESIKKERMALEAELEKKQQELEAKEAESKEIKNEE